MFQFQKNTLSEGKACKYTLYQKEEQLRYIDFITKLQQDEQFRTFFINILSDISFHAYHWETPPVTVSTVDQPFEFVVSNTPGIDLPPDPGPFTQYFNANTEGGIAVFDNLGRDAKLIAPAPIGEDLNYSHIGVFSNEAPEREQHELWKTIGRVTQEHISDQPLWLNTAGGGVAWLHVRLDSRPKYYRYRPYQQR